MAPTRPPLKKLLRLLPMRALAVYSTLAVVRSALMAAVPFLMGAFIDALVYNGKPFYIFTLLAIAALTVPVLDCALKFQLAAVARRRGFELRCELLDTLRDLPPAVAEELDRGGLAMKFFRDAEAVERLIAGFFPQLVSLIAGVLFAVGLALCKKPVVAALFLIFLPVAAAMLWYYKGRFARIWQVTRRTCDNSVSGIFDFMRVFPYLKSMAAEEPYLTAPRSKFKGLRRVNLSNDRTAVAVELAHRIMLFVGEYSMLGAVGVMAWKGELPVGDVVVFQSLFLGVLNSFAGLFCLLPEWENVREGAASLFELLDLEPRETADALPPPPPTENADIVAEHVSFCYPHSAEPVFRDFSCTVKAGTAVAITGANGSGKTTLLKLLTGYLTPTAGCVKIMGAPLGKWQKRALRELVAYVFQDVPPMNGTLLDNITLKNKKYTAEDVAEALRLSGADALAAGMPDGLEHRVGAGRGELSGGERQKLAVARALIRQPKVLVLDEVTNHLDCPSKTKIRDLVAALRGRVTILMVSHDPELVKLCDREINVG